MTVNQRGVRKTPVLVAILAIFLSTNIGHKSALCVSAFSLGGVNVLQRRKATFTLSSSDGEDTDAKDITPKPKRDRKSKRAGKRNKSKDTASGDSITPPKEKEDLAMSGSEEKASAPSDNEELTGVNGSATASIAELVSDGSLEDETTSDAKEPSVDNISPDSSSPKISTETVDKNVLFLQSLGAITNRGEFATPSQKESALTVIAALEASQETDKSPMGTWELVYSNTQLFRASPFFLAGRATCTTPEQAQQYNWFCEMHRKALAISQIRAVRQIVSEDRLLSEFEVEAGSVPFVSSYSGGLPLTITGALVSTASLTYLDEAKTNWELFMDTVEIKGSNLPLFRQLLDIPSVKLPTRDLSDAIQQVFSEYEAPKPMLRTTFCSDYFRISRDQDDNVFVYVKTSDSTEPSDFSAVDSDLGLLGLLEGFNDAVTKLFI